MKPPVRSRPAPPLPNEGLRLGRLSAMVILAMASTARAQTTVTVPITSQVQEPASISVVQNLAFAITPQGLSTGLVITSSAVGGLNANIILANAANNAVSLSVPASISVSRIGGVESITVRTVGTVTDMVNNTPVQITGVASGGFLNTPVSVVGNLDGGVLSFSIGGAVTVADTLVPGNYQGVLTVIAQYN
jgi:hypothetical protein